MSIGVKNYQKNLINRAKENGSQVLVNCASNEYFSAIHSASLSLKVITPVFMERKDDKEKIVSFYAKKARGAMARFIIQNRLTEIDKLKYFNAGGYAYQPDQSDDRENGICKRLSKKLKPREQRMLKNRAPIVTLQAI